MKTSAKTAAAWALGALCAAALAPAWGAPARRALSPERQRAAFLARYPKSAPHKLSDLYKVFEKALGQGLGADVRADSVRLRGVSWELLRDARFPSAEIRLKPFQAQGLRFDKAYFLFKDLAVDRDALWDWRIASAGARETQTQLVFTLRSLAQKLAAPDGTQPRVEADMDSQTLIVQGQGRFCGLSCRVESRCRVAWDAPTKTLRLVPVERSFGGRQVPSWLWGLGSGPADGAPVLDFGSSWIPFNIQQVHLGWDEVDLSTDW